jgi:hypothetical protein
MARTRYRVNPKWRVPLCTVTQTLCITREDADHESIRRKVSFLLKKNQISSTGKLAHKLRRLIRHYEYHPETLPTWTELALYPIEEPVDPIAAPSPQMITFELNDSDELIEC